MHAALGAQERGSREEGSLEGPPVRSASEANGGKKAAVVLSKGEDSGHRWARPPEADPLNLSSQQGGRDCQTANLTY